MLDISTLGEAADVNSLIKFLPHTLHVCVRNLNTGLTSAASLRVDISRTCKVGHKLGVSLPLLTFDVTIPATVPQRSEIPEGLMNCPLFLARSLLLSVDLEFVSFEKNTVKCEYCNLDYKIFLDGIKRFKSNVFDIPYILMYRKREDL